MGRSCIKELDQFPRHGDHRDRRLLPIGEMLVPLVQAVLRFPRLRDDRCRLPLLSPPDGHANERPMVIGPRRLDQRMTTTTVPRLRDRAFPFARPARVFARDQPHVRGQLPRPFEAAPSHNLRRQHHRGLAGNAPEALLMRDHCWERRRQRKMFNLASQFVAPLQLVREQRVILTEHEAIGRRQRRRLARQLLQPAQVWRAPVCALRYRSRAAPGT